MATVLVLLVIVLAGGLFFGLPLVCQSAGERRLIGTWEFQPQPVTDTPSTPQPGSPQPGQTAPTKSNPTGAGSKLQEFMKNLGKNLQGWAQAMTPEMRVTFERDGTFSESMGFGGRRQVVNGQWEVVEGGDDQVVVRVFNADDDNRAQTTELTIRFENDDVMLYPSGSGQPLRMVRQQE